MSNLLFPPVSEADEDGFLGIGSPASVDNLLNAYSSGIFPWPWSEEHIAWFAPPLRAILFFDDLHIPRSLAKVQKKGYFETRINTCFKEVITACAEAKNRKKQQGTWITSGIIDGYVALHNAGYAHSVEVFEGSTLVGGVYGVNLGGYFSGESMFFTVPNASKIALITLIEFLQKNGLTWMDCQVLNESTEKFGAEEIIRDDFMELLHSCLKNPTPLWPRQSV